MSNFFKNFKLAISFILKDKTNLILALIPLSIGFIIFYFLGMYLFGEVHLYLKNFIAGLLGIPSIEGAVGTFIFIILGLMIYYMVSWFFVFIVSLIASPFNDLMSKRIEDKFYLERPNQPKIASPISHEMKPEINWFSLMFKTIRRELKKLLIISFFVVLNIFLSLVPFLMPISFLLMIYLLSYDFLDFSFSRHEYSIKQIWSNMMKNFWSYGMAGVFYLLMLGIPILNLFVPSMACAHFTVLYLNGQKNIS